MINRVILFESTIMIGLIVITLFILREIIIKYRITKLKEVLQSLFISALASFLTFVFLVGANAVPGITLANLAFPSLVVLIILFLILKNS
jgi:hypothetical protein